MPGALVGTGETKKKKNSALALKELTVWQIKGTEGDPGDLKVVIVIEPPFFLKTYPFCTLMVHSTALYNSGREVQNSKLLSFKPKL